MDWSGAVIPAQEPPSPPPRPRVTKKVWITLGIVLVLVIVSAASWKILENYRTKSRVAQELIRETAIAEIGAENSLEVFSVDIEYDPQRNLVVQHDTKKLTSNSLPLFSPNQPLDSPQSFIYKVEVISSSDELLMNGWSQITKETITTNNNTLRFGVVVKYRAEAFIRILLPGGRTLWEGKMT
ncbi:MAG: hypothetical protein Q7S60_04500 [bacterium]|nr:hypothetical protein [bacterium]